MPVQERVHHELARGFDSWGRFVARNPRKVLVTSLFFFITLFAGCLRLRPENRSYYLWVPTDSKAYRDWKYVEDRFGIQGHNLVFYARAKSGNIFDFDGITQLMRAHRFTVNLQTEVRGETVKFTDACKRLAEFDDPDYDSDKQCHTPSLLSLWNYEENTLIGSKTPILDKLTALHQFTNVESFAANVVFEERDDGSKKVVSAEAVALVFPLRSETGASYDIQPAWNDGVAGVVDRDVVEVFRFSNRSFDDEVGRLVSGDIPLFALGMFIITLFVSLTLGPPTSLHRSRVLLGVMAIANVLLAVGAGFGISALAGVRFPVIAALLPLILLGVQVDSVIIFVDNLNAEPPTDPLEERVGKAVSRAGPAVLVTALTTVTAFATSVSTVMPAVAMFASFAAISFALAFAVANTFFLALLVLDEQRLQAGRISFAPCLRAPGAHTTDAAPPVVALPAADVRVAAAPPPRRSRSNKPEDVKDPNRTQRLIRTYYAPTILSLPVAALIVLAFVTVAALSASVFSRVELGLPIEDVLPDVSYLRDALTFHKRFFGGQTAFAQVVMRGENFEREATRDAYRRARRSIVDLPFVTHVAPDWLTRYEFWRAMKGHSSEEGHFLDGLHDFLGEIGNTVFQDDVVCDRESSCKHPSDVRYFVIYPSGSGAQIEQLALRAQIERELRAEGFDSAFVFEEGFLTAESDEAAVYLTWTNLVYALVAIFGIMLIFNPLPIAFWITVCVALIDVDLVGAIWAVGLKLNSITYVNLVMAVGLSVDYCVHIAHTFNDAHNGALADAAPGQIVHAKDSAAYALVTMGASVIKGGVTTVLGVLVIAFASSVVFRTFFAMISFTVLLGLLHGIVLLPILLAYVTVLPPWCCAKRAHAGGEASAKPSGLGRPVPESV